MAKKSLKKIFLSASIPARDRDAKYFETADVIAIRDSVIALATAILPKFHLVWGGHPSITPLIYHVMEKKGLSIQNHLTIYQSYFFEETFPEDNNKFENVIFTEKKEDKDSSMLLLREKMFFDNRFSAGIFIGGMEGLEAEYEMFNLTQKDALLLPIATTGGASRQVYTRLQTKFMDSRLEHDYGYMSLFQDLLLDRL